MFCAFIMKSMFGVLASPRDKAKGESTDSTGKTVWSFHCSYSFPFGVLEDLQYELCVFRLCVNSMEL